MLLKGTSGFSAWLPDIAIPAGFGIHEAVFGTDPLQILNAYYNFCCHKFFPLIQCGPVHVSLDVNSIESSGVYFHENVCWLAFLNFLLMMEFC